MSREAIAQALFALVSSATLADGATPAFATASRRLKLWGDVPLDARPALFMVEHGEDHSHQAEDVQIPTRRFEVKLYIYTDGKDPNTVPATTLNNLLDAVDAALQPSMVTGTQTLGGLVQHCYVSGKVMMDPGDLDGDGMLVVPINILAP